jgi:hypothetical protein
MDIVTGLNVVFRVRCDHPIKTVTKKKMTAAKAQAKYV